MNSARSHGCPLLALAMVAAIHGCDPKAAATHPESNAPVQALAVGPLGPDASNALAVGSSDLDASNALAVGAATRDADRSSSPPIYAVDDIGITVGGQRLTTPLETTEKSLRERVAAHSEVNGSAVIHATRTARLALVGALTRALGQVGVATISIVTPRGGQGRELSDGGDQGKNPALKIWPLGRVPMHVKRCGAFIAIQGDNTADLERSQGRPRLKLPQTQDGPDVSGALADVRKDMNGCESTVWMIKGEDAALWGPAFQVGIALSRATPLRETRFVMLL